MTAQSFKRSVQIREAFMDRPMRSAREEAWNWPTKLQEVGTCESVMYTSDKWQKDRRLVDYKHVAEAPQKLLVPRGGLSVPTYGPMINLTGDFPDSFAFLADCLGLQTRLYRKGGKPGDYFQLDFPRCKVGAGKFGDGGTFLIIYDTRSVHAVVIGEELDVLKDGIVG